MESNSRAPALEVNEKETEMVRQKKWVFNWFLKFCRVSHDRIVAGSLFHDAGPATANAQSLKLVFVWKDSSQNDLLCRTLFTKLENRSSTLRQKSAVTTTNIAAILNISIQYHYGSYSKRMLLMKKCRSVTNSSRQLAPEHQGRALASVE